MIVLKNDRFFEYVFRNLKIFLKSFCSDKVLEEIIDFVLMLFNF